MNPTCDPPHQQSATPYSPSQDNSLADDIEDKNQSYFECSAGKVQSTSSTSRSGGSEAKGRRGGERRRKKSYFTQLFSKFSWRMGRGKKGQVEEEEEEKKAAREEVKQMSASDYQQHLQQIIDQNKAGASRKQIFKIQDESDPRVPANQTQEDEFLSSSDEEENSSPVINDPQNTPTPAQQTQGEFPKQSKEEAHSSSEEEDEDEDEYDDEGLEEEIEEEDEEEENKSSTDDDDEEEDYEEFEELGSCVHRLPCRNQFAHTSSFFELVEVQKVPRELPKRKNFFLKWLLGQEAREAAENKRSLAFAEGRLLTLKGVEERARDYGKDFAEEEEEDELPELKWNCRVRKVRDLKALVSVSFLNFRDVYQKIREKVDQFQSFEEVVSKSDKIRLQLKWQLQEGEVVDKYLINYENLENFVQDMRYHLARARNWEVKSIMT